MNAEIRSGETSMPYSSRITRPPLLTQVKAPNRPVQ
jgi:hypothetical protein